MIRGVRLSSENAFATEPFCMARGALSLSRDAESGATAIRVVVVVVVVDVASVVDIVVIAAAVSSLQPVVEAGSTVRQETAQGTFRGWLIQVKIT